MDTYDTKSIYWVVSVVLHNMYSMCVHVCSACVLGTVYPVVLMRTCGPVFLAIMANTFVCVHACNHFHGYSGPV